MGAGPSPHPVPYSAVSHPPSVSWLHLHCLAHVVPFFVGPLGRDTSGKHAERVVEEDQFYWPSESYAEKKIHSPNTTIGKKMKVN